MNSFFLNDYSLHGAQTYLLTGLEYSKQHFEIAWKEKSIVHGLVGLTEFVPLIGSIVAVCERFLAGRYLGFDPFLMSSSFIRYNPLKAGSQRDCDGSVEIEKARSICRELNQKNSNGVCFTESKIDETISGGTCSAMSFDFASRYLEMRKTLSPQEILDQIELNYEESTQEFRTIQAAFNTIGKTSEIEPDDFSLEKIDAMLHFYNRKIEAASEPLDIQEEGAVKKMSEILEELKEGIFIVRSICPAENEKGEVQGHSTVLIREKDKDYFYEPNSGVCELEKGFESTTLCHALVTFHLQWDVPLTRVYQIA